MIKIGFGFCAALAVLTSAVPGRAADAPASPSGVDLQRTLKGVEDRYNKIQTLQVKFTENLTSRGRTKTDSGTLYLRKKGKMRWEYASGQLFVSDAKFIYSYYPDEHRAEKMSMKESDDMKAPLAFLLGDVNFARDFGEYRTKPQDGGLLITALPKSDKFPYTEVTFLVAPDSTMRRLEVKLQNNDLMVFTFEGEKKNPLLADTLFQFTPPKGVELDDLTR
jgi:outer membrane lipoprotein carrier protein